MLVADIILTVFNALMVLFLKADVMEKLDLTKKYKTYFSAKKVPELVVIEAAKFIAIEGKGDPSGAAFAADIETLYPVAYAIKFAFKAKGRDFVVSKLEGQWWYDEEKYPGNTMDAVTTEVPRSEWEYRLLIRMPDFAAPSDLEAAKEKVFLKKDLPAVKKIKWFTMTEGKSVQMLHVGPFSTEPESLKSIGKFVADYKLGRNGLHHEIYLSDFRKTKPEKLKTILREPVG